MSADTATPDGDFVFNSECPSRVILDQIADKWSMMVLAVLYREPQRFNAIKRRLGGVTQRVLTHTLRKLERNGMVSRTVIDSRVLGVEYALTPLGRSLNEPFSALFTWTTARMSEIRRHQQDYDARTVSRDDVHGRQPGNGPADFARSGIPARSA